MKSKEILEVEDSIKYIVSSSLKGLTPSYIEDYLIYDYKKLIRIALQNLILGGELIYDEKCRLHLKPEVKEQKEMNEYSNIKEVFAALAEGKKLKKVGWGKDSYIRLYCGFIYWNDNVAYCDSFDGSWEEYVDEKKYSFDDLVIGGLYKYDECFNKPFRVLYKGREIIVGHYSHNNCEICLHKSSEHEYTRV